LKSKKHNWLFSIVRLVVCVLALTWVLSSVTYSDYITIDGQPASKVVVERDGQLTVENADGLETSVACANGDCTTDDRIVRGLRSTWDVADKSMLLLCLLVFAPVPILQSWRLMIMLKAQEIRMTFWESLKVSFAGNFLNFVTALGSTGGDVFKMYYASLHTDRKTEAAITVILERVVGLFGLVMVVLAVMVLRKGDSHLSMFVYGLSAVAVGSAALGLILFSDRVRALIRPHHILARLPFSDHLQRAEAATRRLAHHKALVLSALLASCLLHVISISAFTLAAIALGMNDSPSAIIDYYAYFPSGMVIAAIPISFQGLGTMEAFFKSVLLGTHGNLSQILCLAMMIRLIALLWSLPGFVVTMTGSYRPRVSDEDVQLASG
jgi:glycosyltransferase 2 family protein